VAVRQAKRLWPAALGLLIVVGLFLTAVYEWSGASLAGDPAALARVQVEPFGGRLQAAKALGPGGRPIPLAVTQGRLTPRDRVAPGETVRVEVTLERPGWSAWLIGDTQRETLTVKAPTARVLSRWVTADADGRVPVRFSEPVATVAYAGKRVTGRRERVDVPAPTPAGTLRVAVAARPWESLGPPATVHWFPRARAPVALVSPAPDGRLSPAGPIRLTFAGRPLKPRLDPATPGHWRRLNGHTLEFTPSGFGIPLGAHERLTFAHTLAVAGADGRGLKAARELAWTVPEPSTLRLHQLLAEQGYLPVSWHGDAVAKTDRAQAGAAALPPDGDFTWRYPNTPP
jgi:hypothetical protein